MSFRNLFKVLWMDIMFVFLLMDKLDQGKRLLWRDKIFKIKLKGKITYYQNSIGLFPGELN